MLTRLANLSTIYPVRPKETLASPMLSQAEEYVVWGLAPENDHLFEQEVDRLTLLFTDKPQEYPPERIRRLAALWVGMGLMRKDPSERELTET